MVVDEETDLDQRDRDRGVAPGLELASIDSDGSNAFDTLSPLPCLLMVSEIASKGKEGSVIIVMSGIDQPAIEFNAGTSTYRRGSLTGEEHVFQLCTGRIFKIK